MNRVEKVIAWVLAWVLFIVGAVVASLGAQLSPEMTGVAVFVFGLLIWLSGIGANFYLMMDFFKPTYERA